MFVDLNEHANQTPGPRPPGFLVILVAALTITWFGPGTRVIADEDESRLRQRITELEAENRALRKIITGIQGALESLPKTSLPKTDNLHKLRIVVMPGNWGGSELEDIRRVCLSSAGTIWSQLADDGLAPILVQRSESGPISLYRRGQGNEYVV
ncbi:MAG: hypothetical protein QGH11_12010, partial [Pirellulaceae bacterium]|nr:hypothetical protein [Pirellulaceae bacterium]